jgi:tetratricopeptide (TPR) repeat protein
MFEYKRTEKFDIGAGHGEYEYDFLTINDNKDDFLSIIDHYCYIYKGFNFFFDKFKKIKNNIHLSPVVKAKMKEHNANISITLLDENCLRNKICIRQMIVNKQKSDDIYEMYTFYFYHFTEINIKDYLERGLIYAKSNLHNAAISHFNFAIKLDPNYDSSFIYRGISFLLLKNYDKAIEDFTQAININSEDSKAFSLRGFAYKETGDFEKAKADFLKSLDINEGDDIANDGLAEINDKETRS